MYAPKELYQSMASTAKWITNLLQIIKSLMEQVGQSEGENLKKN